ncbi:MAG: hypothetical protein IJE66_07790 [Akkermansia sp.]|nr:hypothetical protein [Akkermansia sp.]
MKAIDFACRLLVNVSRDDMSPAARLVLLCVMAGLESSDAIALFTGMSVRTCTGVLRNLESRQLLCRIGDDLYLTTAGGKERIRRLFDFNPEHHRA